jgi:hypothetical protein
VSGGVVRLGDMNADTVVMFSLDDVDFELETELELVPWSGVRPEDEALAAALQALDRVDAPS